MFPDHFVYTRRRVAPRAIERALFDLRPGVTEVYVHPAVDSDELRASHPDWPGRVEDHAFVCDDPSLPDLLERAGVTLIGYRELRELQRVRDVRAGVSAGGVTPAALARLCAAALPHEDLTADDLEACCFGPGARSSPIRTASSRAPPRSSSASTPNTA